MMLETILALLISEQFACIEPAYYIESVESETDAISYSTDDGTGDDLGIISETTTIIIKKHYLNHNPV
jgi:hypothetical protein